MVSTRAVGRPGAAVLVLALAMALWIASTLGFVHRIVHPPAVSGTASVAAASAQLGRVHAHGGLAALFGDHAGAGDCRLYDQIAGGAAVLSIPLVVLPVVLPTARFDYFLGEALARWVALFDARGPPATR